eukprot:3683541-Ditylum_brightwellii.AAC.1
MPTHMQQQHSGEEIKVENNMHSPNGGNLLATEIILANTMREKPPKGPNLNWEAKLNNMADELAIAACLSLPTTAHQWMPLLYPASKIA